jgi:hypothetical protein
MNSNDINEKQNQPEAISLLKAADAAYSYARRADSFRTVGTIASLVAAMTAAVRADLVEFMAVAGVVGALLNELARRFLTLPWTRQGMLFQEWLDTSLFGLAWNPTLGRKPREEDRRYWEKRFSGDENRKRDWYVDIEGLPPGHAVLLCQRENLSWDARLRRIWGTTLLTLAVAVIVLGLLIGWYADWKVSELVMRWLVPAAPALIFIVDSGLRHRRIADEKDDLINRVEDLLEDVPVSSARGEKQLLARAREFQNHLARLRAEETRVPQWLFDRLRGAYEDEAATAAKSWHDKLLRQAREP